MNEGFFKEAHTEIGQAAAKLVTGPNCKGREDALCVATALMTAAEAVLLQIGDAGMAAQQFYADRLAGAAKS